MASAAEVAGGTSKDDAAIGAILRGEYTFMKKMKMATSYIPMRPLSALLRASLLIVLTGYCCIAAAQQPQLVFMQLADPQMGMFSKNHDVQQEVENLNIAVDVAKRLRPQFVVVCGDMINSSQSEEQVAAFRKGIAQLDAISLHLVPGNHDVGGQPTLEQLRTYRDRFGPDYYTFESGDFTGVVLNSMLMGDANAPEESARQLEWLEHVLHQLEGREVAVFQHIPFFVHSEDEVDSYWNVPSKARAEYLSVLRRHGVQHVFAGHLHYPAHAEANGISIVITGATGKPLNNSASGLGLVEIDTTGTWRDKFFPLTAPPKHLIYPW
jgi:predicted phosphodiesterase